MGPLSTDGIAAILEASRARYVRHCYAAEWWRGLLLLWRSHHSPAKTKLGIETAPDISHTQM
jgi:hypothetical protein